MKRMWIKTGVVLLGIGCWFLALLFYGKMEKQAGCFNTYYDAPVLTRNGLSAFMEQAGQPESLLQTTGWSIEEKQSVSSEIRENITADIWKIAGSMESFFSGQLFGGSYPWEEDEEKSEPASSAQNLLMQMTGKEPDGFLREICIVHLREQ